MSQKHALYRNVLSQNAALYQNVWRDNGELKPIGDSKMQGVIMGKRHNVTFAFFEFTLYRNDIIS